MASTDKKSAFEERIKKRREEMSKNNTVGTGKTAPTQTQTSNTKESNKDKQTLFAERISERKSSFTNNYTVDDKFINTFLSDANKYFDTAKSDYDRMTYSTASSIYDSESQTVRDLTARYGAIQNYMRNNRDKFDVDYYDTFMAQLNDIGEAMHSYHHTFYDNNKYFSQWETEEEYNFWLDHNTVESRQQWYAEQEKRLEELKAQKKSGSWFQSPGNYEAGSPEYLAAEAANAERLQALNDEIAAVESEIQNYKRGNYNEYGQYYGNKTLDDYHAITERPDFEVTSANRDYDNPTREELWEYDTSASEGTVALGYGGSYDDEGNILDVNGNIVRYAKGPEVEDKLGMFLAAGEEGVQEAYNQLSVNSGNYTDTWANIMQEGDTNGWKYLDETEIAIYYALLDDSQEAAYKFLSDMSTELTKRETMARKAYIEEAPVLEQIFLNAASIPMNVIGGGVAFVDDAINVLQGEEINPYSRAHAMQNTASAIREDTAKDINNLTGNLALPWLGTTFGDVYQSIMSAGDSLFGTMLGGNAYGILMGMGAASSEMKDLYEQGASIGQIAAGGILAGAAEMVFEKYSIDKLINMKDAKSVSQIIKNLLVQGGIEASEEMATEIANTITNAIVMGKQSDWVDAETFAKNVANAGIGGFISGGFSGGLSSIASYGQYNQQAKETGKTIMEADGGVDALKALAMDVAGADSKLTKQAGKVTGETYTGEGLIGKATAAAKTGKSQKAVGKLYDAVQTEVTAQNQADLAKRIEGVGFSAKSAKNIASAVIAQLNGEELSKVQESALEIVKHNEKVQEAINGVFEDAGSSVNTRTFNLDKYDLGIKVFGKGIAPSTTETGTEKAEKIAPRNITVSENGKMMNTETQEVIDTPVLAQAEDGTYKVVDKNAGLVSSENVSYESYDQGLVVENFVNLSTDYGKKNKVIASMDLASRNKLMSLYNPAVNPEGGMFVNGVLDAYFYGHRGVDLSVAQKGSPINKLTDQQKQIAWETGRAAGEKATATEQSNIDTVYAEAQKVLEQTGKTKKGTYHATLEAGISHFNLTPEQKVVYNVAEEIAQGIQTNIRVYDGTNTAQGFYNHETDEIMLNLNAANKGRDAIMAFTLAHEIVHRAKKGSPAKYQAFTEFLMKEYGKQGSDVEAMIQEQMDAAERFNKTVPKDKQIVMTEEKALEEVVCDACATMLLDTNAGQKLAEFGAQSKENRGFLEDLKRWISDLLERLRNYFKGIDPESDAAREFAKFEDNVKQTLAKMYVEMATEAGEKLSTIKAAYGGLDSVLKKNAEAIAEDAIITEGAVVTDGERSYSIKSMKADIAEGKMFEDLKNVCGWTQRQVNELKQSLEELVEYMTPFRDILDMNETYGREGRRFSPYKPNSDPLYKISMDFSTLCSKRLLTQYVIENLQLRENRPMSAEEQMAIRDMLNEYRKVEKGLQVACAMCYVEAARLKSPKQINKWLDDPATQMRNYFADKNAEFAAYIKEKQADFKESRGYDRNATKKDMSAKDVRELNKIRPRLRSQYEVNAEEAKIIERATALPSSSYLTAGNLATLSETDPVIYSAYTAFVRTATRSKSLETDEPYYYGDSTRDNGNGIVVTDSFIESVNRENGMRFSSWSDWRIQHLLDYITAVIDNSVRGAAMHGYTKFGDEVRVLGKTGMMFNMSGVSGTQTGLNEDGSLSFSPTESVDVNEAIQLRDEFPETAGLQCIGVSYDHIVALLRSDIIDYVIPYHVSGLNAALRAMANIHGWDDFTSTQHAAIDKSIKLEDAVDKEHWREEPVFSEFFVGYDTGMTGIEAMRASADRYVQMCKDRGLKPKFEQFLGEENYWKLLIDRKMINQKTGKLIQQRAVTPTFDFSTIKAVVDKYVQNYDSGLESRALNHIVENWDSIPKRIKDLKKQGGKKAKKASKAVDTLSNQTLAAQPKGVVQGERSYSLPKVDTDGKQLSADQQEFFKDSKVRDEQGRLIPMYHGTNTPNFTVFDPQKSDDHISLFFTSDPDVANTYTQLQDKGRDVDPYNLITEKSTAEQFNAAQERVGGGLRVVKITPEWIQQMKKKAEQSSTRLLGVANKYADLLESINEGGVFNYDIERIREVTGDGTRLLKEREISTLRSAMGSAKDHLFFVKDKRTREISRIYSDTYKLFDETRNYAIAAATNKGEIGLYTYTETNSSVPFRLGNLYPGTEKNMVANAIDRMKWVEEHHLGNRYKVYLNVTNPYILDAGEDYSGVKKKVILEYDYRAGEWTVKLDSDTFIFDRDEFEDFALNAFDDKTYGEIEAQIQDDNDADSSGWDDDSYGRYVDHYIKLKNVSVSYVAPGNWNALNFNGNENARTRDVAAWAKENGYDGVIFKNMKDTGGYAFMKGRGGSTVVTAFSSEQVKSVDNLKPTSDPDIRYRLPKMGDKKPPTTLTEEDLRELLQKVKNREMHDGTYFPVRINTPDVLLDAVRQIAKKLGVTNQAEIEKLTKDRPMAIQVYKARKSISTIEEWDGDGLPHELSIDDFVGIVKKMEEPEYIVYEADEGRYVEILRYKTEKGKYAFAIVELENFKGDSHMNGYGYDTYNMFVTVYQPDSFKRITNLLKKEGNIVVEPQKNKGNLQLTSGIHVPSVLNKSPFAPSVPQEENVVKNDIEKPTDNKYIKMVEDGATHIGEYDIVPKEAEPKKTILAWKALVVKPGAKNNPNNKGYGNMYPPQVHQVASTPYGVWLYANEAPKKLGKDGKPELTKYGRPKVKEGMTYRPAWHFGDVPYASQFRSTHGFFDDNGVRRFYMSESKGILVWALCEMAADENYQDEADMAGHIGENRYWDEQQASLWYLPENGYYKYMTNRVDPNSVTWYLSDKMRIVQTITDAEMRDILTWVKEDGATDLEFNYPLRIDGKDVDPADYGIPVGNVVGDGIDYVDRWKNQFREIAMNGEIDITQSHFYYVPSSATNYGSYETVSFSKEVDDHSQELIKTKKDAKILFANSSSKSSIIQSFEAETGVKVKEAKTIAGRKKIIEAAKNAGYDIVEFAKEGKSLGSDVVIINPDSVIRNYKFNNVSERYGRTDAVDYKLPVGEDTSPRALLANAFEGIITNDIEKRKIQEYKGKVEMLNDEEKKLSELRAQIKELSFAKGKRDTKKIRDLQFDANHTANRIATLDKMLLGLEASAPLQNILKREKEMAFKRGLEKNKEKSKTARQQVIETREKRYAREKLQKLVIETAKWISYPSKTDVKCPDILKQPYADFLNGIDLSSKRLAAGGDPTKNDLRLTNAMDSLATALDRVMASQDPNQDTTAVLDTGYLDLPAGFVQKLRDMTESVKAMMVEGEFVVNAMSAAEVRQLSQMIRTLNHAIKEVSTLYANLRFANVEALGDDTMSFIDDLGEIEKSSGMKDFVQWENALPYYAFKRFGNGGVSIFEGLMDAQDKLAYLAQQIFGFSEKTWTDKEAKAWSEDTHTIDLPDGEKLTLTTADAMSIYCLSRREQGLKHLLGGGTRVMGIQKGSKKAQDSRSTLTIKDLNAIISSLTDRQKQVAEAIQEFMSTTCSEWGNEISMKRFLTKEFNEKFYFPIESNDENLPTKDPSAQQSDLFRLLNISATKPIDPRANNEVIVRNIFDVFTGHASDMARLNAYGMALLDYMKWLNYREKTVNDEGQVKVRGVRKSMEKAYGNAAKSYVLNLIKDVNGRASDGGDPTILMKWMRTAKTASVGSSLRVATLQITSYPRAALVLSPKSLALGLSKLPKIEMAKKYCGIALWKSFGFYDTNIARSIEDQMKGVKDVKQKLIELSLKGAEWGDAITWGALWNACEYEVAAAGKYTVGTEEFYQAVGKKLREVVYATQVVDSTLTRSQIMRSKRGMAQEAAAFMSEPTLSANILMDAGFEFNMEKRRTGSAKAAWKKTGKYIGRAVAVYSIGQLTAALLEGLWDAWRDDDDEEFDEKYLKAFLENLVLDLVPFNKIPIVSDVFEAALAMFGVGFYSSDKMSTTWLTQAVSAADAWKEVLGGDSSMTVYNAMYKSMRAISSFYGVSFSGVMREAVALWNNTAGAYDITWKIRTWDLAKAVMASEALDAIIEGNDRQEASLRAEFADEDSYLSAMRTAIKDRYNAGEIDYNTAMQYLIEHGGMEADEAFWKIEEWTYDQKAEEAFGKYNEFYGAVRTGTNLKAIIKKYTDNGVTMDTLKSQITEHFKPLYIEMSTSEKAGIKGYLLNAMTLLGITREEAEKKISAWEFESKYGFAYGNKKEAYLSGKVSYAEMKAILMNVGGRTEELAEDEIAEWQYEADHPELAGKISFSQYQRWQTDGQPRGVSVELFTDVAEYRDDGTSGSSKSQEEVAAYINSLPISIAEKDGLWLCFWKESTLKKAPWH